MYLAPGANAVTTAAAVQKTLQNLSSRFPQGMKYLVQFDTTTFVTDTIFEVLKTLGEAFVLVVIVVYLFLGNIRATIIPTVAVPVSLIGAFAVLLAMGFSANTVSLLAMVLAIGIMVDDAIVVVENVERVMEEEPDLTPAEATKKAMAQISCSHHCDHVGAVVRVRARRLHFWHFRHAGSASLPSPISAAMLISALNALTLSPALCAVFLRPHHGPRRGFMAEGARCNRLDPRPLCRRGSAPVACGYISIGRGRGVCRRHFRSIASDADRLHPRRGSGRVLRDGAIA